MGPPEEHPRVNQIVAPEPSAEPATGQSPLAVEMIDVRKDFDDYTPDGKPLRRTLSIIEVR